MRGRAEDPERPVRALPVEPHPNPTGAFRQEAEDIQRRRDEAAERARVHEVVSDPRPIAERLRREREGAPKGGRAGAGKRKARAVTDEQLRAEVTEERGKGRTLTDARRTVGRRHSIPLTTLRDRTR